MIGNGKKKLCVTEDVSLLTKGGSASCAICCASSDDVRLLCEPVRVKGTNLFCE